MCAMGPRVRRGRCSSRRPSVLLHPLARTRCLLGCAPHVKTRCTIPRAVPRQCIILSKETPRVNDDFNLARFTEAQAPLYDTVVAELRAARKRTHWMWFILPQLAGLGRSATAQRYAIASLAEARAYLAHPVLGARLRECTELIAAAQGSSAHQIFGDPDHLKLHSSLTLFARAAPGEPVFQACLDKYFKGVPIRRRCHCSLKETVFDPTTPPVLPCSRSGTGRLRVDAQCRHASQRDRPLQNHQPHARLFRHAF